MEEIKKHSPYIPSERVIPELTLVPMILGTILGIIFGTASLYLALRIGLTVSASIPVAVMSISIFKWLSKALGTRPATILENNIVQTAGSAGESIAFGVAVTMPALLILGHDMDLTRIMIVAVLGGLLGILMMVPLRRGLIVKEHGKLTYPEGTACAEVLIAGEKGGTNAKTIFTGFGLGVFYKLLSGDPGLNVIKNTPSKMLSWFKGGSVANEVAPELMGVGYIIGPGPSGNMTAGGVLAYLVLIPIIKIFGEDLPTVLFPASKLIKEMSPGEVRNAYILYIGAGAVAAGGIISMFRALPTIAHAFIAGFKDLLGGQKEEAKSEKVERVDQDLPMSVIILGCVALVVALWCVPSMHLNLMSAMLIVLFGFLFVTVSSRLTGEIGSTNNPISGMTVASLLLTCLIFVALGKTSPSERVAALMIAAIVCVASSNGGTTSQDLKTGYLIGATPKLQQIAILIGAMASALVIGVMLKVFNDSATIFAKRDVPGFQVPSSMFEKDKQTLHGPEAKYDSNSYNVVHFISDNAPRTPDGKIIVEPGKYLVDDLGNIKYLVDPGINGVLTQRDLAPDQTKPTEVKKYDAPKARLMSLIIDGILTRKLPWGLVLLGVFITLMMELCGLPALAFAVGVYLPIAVSLPIGIGGFIRYLVDRKTKDKSSAESDSSPGVLFSSGLIAGGAIAGMLVAVIAGFWPNLAEVAGKTGSFFGSLPQSDFFSILTFAGLGYFLYLVGRGKVLRA